MPSKKIKIEFYDDSHIKHTVTLEGEVPRDKISQILDYIELMGGASEASFSPINKQFSDTKYDRVKRLILSYFLDKIFNSKDVQISYFEVYNDKINLSTISTYLSRLVDSGFLKRGGSSGEWNYVISYKKEKAFT